MPKASGLIQSVGRETNSASGVNRLGVVGIGIGIGYRSRNRFHGSGLFVQTKVEPVMSGKRSGIDSDPDSDSDWKRRETVPTSGSRLASLARRNLSQALAGKRTLPAEVTDWELSASVSESGIAVEIGFSPVRPSCEDKGRARDVMEKIGDR